jgi:hypothetical protein
MSKPSRMTMTVLILALASVASAQPRTPPPRPSSAQNGTIGAELEAIHFCLRQVRQRAPESRFNAHMRPDGKLRMTGSEHDKAVFLRCMAEDRGFSFD